MKNNCKGFSLIELAIGLVVIGLLVAAVTQWVKTELVKSDINSTKDRAEIVIAAINAYYDDNGHYPWPANPAVTEGNSNYGKQDLALPSTSAPNEVVRGSVPFADLKISMKDTLDGWNNKFTYAVSKNQTGPPAPMPMPTTGVITVSALVPSNPPQPPPNDWVAAEVPGVYWVLVSHGKSGSGAYASSGVLIPCPTAAPVPAEADNCDGDDHFYMSGDKSGTTTAQRSTRDGGNYMDDYTYYTDEIYDRGWVNVQSTANQDNAINNFGIIGIKTDNPGQRQQLNPVTGNMEWVASGVDFDINGTARANFAGPNPTDEKGFLNSQKFCADGGGDCFEAKKIGGTGMQDCFDNTNPATPPNGMAGIGFNAAKCLNTATTIPAFDCGSGYAVGFDATGAIVCGN
ncbi:MAG: type II secretion system protein [Proteobacteria bacterium]|nr:type II secretion system protein [Pseudomonadota bacterium]